ncbi:MAG: CoA-binding protein [Pseudomonadales bacterium]|nr:CoA-binding protein [Pseudomonadales bacterium]MDP6469744.1 CoA-binding protein [Pseudomonadales bacterium]MDP6827655.1 CoA-binding protein [Pseudomonadales bacterium]MDP6971905.1 CoA-binding protein [Pseudomonadales bacterium]
MTDHPLDPIFNPRAVAVVGVRSKPSAGMMGSFYDSLLESDFQAIGGLYPVNPKVDEIKGYRCYPSLLDTPDPVDHVISQVPAAAVPELVDQCVAKKVRSIHFFTAGFSETGDEEMATVERAMIEKLRNAGIRAIGPNCMGLYVPSSRLAFMSGFPTKPGNVFLLSQSGANAGEIISGLVGRGVRFSKAISYGNGADLRAHDFLDYAASDPDSHVVAAYIEGVRDGRAFFDALKRCARVKPVVILKGGRTQSGSHAAHSHTGSLAGSIEVFDAACRQAGAARAETMDELHDLIVAASTSTRRVTGRGVALFGGGGGGFAVLSADAIDREGLTVPKLPQSAVEEMRKYIPVAGSSVNNPIDAFPPEEYMEDMLRLVATAEGIDTLFMSPISGMRPPPGVKVSDPKDGESPPAPAEIATRAASQMSAIEADTGTPVVGILRSGRMARMMGLDVDAVSHAAYEAGIGMYPSVARAARTVAQVLDWKAYREGLPEIF